MFHKSRIIGVRDDTFEEHGVYFIIVKQKGSYGNALRNRFESVGTTQQRQS